MCIRDRIDGAGPGLGVADRVAGGQGDPADDAVGDGGLAGGGPDDGLLAAQREVAERVAVALAGQQRPQPLLVLLADRVDGAARAEGGEQHGEQQQHRHDVDAHVHPAGRDDRLGGPLTGRQGDQPHHAVPPALREGGLGAERGDVGGADEQGRDQRGEQQADGGDGAGERRVGAVALGVELVAAQQQGPREGGGQDQGDPVLRVLADFLVRGERVGEQQGQEAAEDEVEDPGGPLAAAEGDGEQQREQPGGEPRGEHVRGVEVLDVVAPEVLPERNPHRAEEVDEGDGAQIPHRERGAVP